MKLTGDGKSIRAVAQILAVASWNVLKKKETTGVLSKESDPLDGQQCESCKEIKTSARTSKGQG